MERVCVARRAWRYLCLRLLQNLPSPCIHSHITSILTDISASTTSCQTVDSTSLRTFHLLRLASILQQPWEWTVLPIWGTIRRSGRVIWYQGRFLGGDSEQLLSTITFYVSPPLGLD